MRDREFWELKFSVEVSTRYHDWRRTTFEGWARIIKVVTLIGAVFTLLTAFNPLQWETTSVQAAIAASAVVIACMNLVDLIWDFNGMALRHTELYRRFKELQEKIARQSSDHADHLDEWNGDAQAIRRDEPPTYWAIYAMCWNQTLARYQTGEKGYLRPVGLLQKVFKNVFYFRPQDFPAS